MLKVPLQEGAAWYTSMHLMSKHAYACQLSLPCRNATVDMTKSAPQLLAPLCRAYRVYVGVI